MPRQLRSPVLVVASHNPGKAAELIELLGSRGLRLMNAKELGLPVPEEDAATFMGNAAIKARAAAAASGHPAIADDSGLVVPALGGAPGVLSRRWSLRALQRTNPAFGRLCPPLAALPEPRNSVAITRTCRLARAAHRRPRCDGLVLGKSPTGDYAEAMVRVHDALGDRSAAAEMVCALAIGWPDGHAQSYEGRVPGALVWPPRGDLGFGYEPMFVPEGSQLTYGEMIRADKRLDDPRARAFAQFGPAVLVSYPVG